jgi:hypothetical protein
MSGAHPETGDPIEPGAIVSFPLSVGMGGGFENLHAVFDRGNNYVLDNSPFYVFGVSVGDSVEVVRDGNRLIFSRVVARGGHSTYRVKLPPQKPHDHFLRLWARLELFGCSFEGSSSRDRRLYAIDVPPAVDVAAIYSILSEHEDAGDWEFEEAHLCDLRS